MKESLAKKMKKGVRGVWPRFFVILFLETNVGIRFDIFSKAQKLYNDIFLRFSRTVSEKYFIS